MLTYSTALSTLQSLTGVPSTDTTTSALLIQFWNDSRRTVAGIRGGSWPWLQIERTVDTVADQDYIYIPNDIRRVTAMRVVVGTGTSATIYLPVQVCDIKRWQVALAARLGSNQYPYFAFQQGQKILMTPIPSETGTDVVLTGPRVIRDINIADYNTGNIVSIANGATAVVGTGTSWTASMAGRYIRITESDTANKGDGYWYEIASVGSATTLTLVKPYQGTSIVAGTAAYSLGLITYEPETWQMAPIYRAVAQYWDLHENFNLSERYWLLYDGGQEIGKRELPAGMIGQMLEEAGETYDGNYIAPSDNDLANVQIAPYYYPTQDASGF
jgi:hypothetical protein